MRLSGTGAIAGLAAGGAGVGASQAIAAALPGTTSPLIAVANRVIDWTPRQLKEFAIEQFGTNDKPVLLASVIAGMVIVLALVGAMGRTVGITALAVLVAVAGVVVLADRPTTDGPILRLVPVAVLGAIALGSFAWLLRAAPDTPAPDTPAAEAAAPPGFDRRNFLATVGVLGAVAVGGTVAGQTVLAPGTGRSGVRLPPPRSPAAPLPAGTALKLPGLTPYITDNRDFYRVDTALRVPRVAVDDYRLRIHGLVDAPIELSFQDLLDLPLIERRITLTCVSQPVGGPYVGNATWIGVRTRDLLSRVGVGADADAVKSTSVDGMTIGTPLTVLTDDRDAMLAVAMNGEPLPPEHGFPVRMVVPGLYGYVSATKWLTDLEVTRFADFSAYWTSRGYAAQAPIKTASRIDVPKSFARIPAGRTPVAGVAWAQHRGIERVEVRVDRGVWQPAQLAERDGIDCWRQWVWQWDATPGNHMIEARATDATGIPQTEERVPIAPDGATGWPGVQVRVD
ncbi:molybdopterin-dependent oxidoreductase [Skermania piniformis]|uniref:Molybdopterin-dependent oxidoreductase n=1 Tax=Skermania pinensis TaxID=39122 RepID=A0ABX8S986_9ACTN|nr:molybdopterin-dependent oxidoreductase [Skermania piniformis]QXQ13851.1 molybdopterin-dependent oxidoreductase [Skermania piniformis]